MPLATFVVVVFLLGATNCATNDNPDGKVDIGTVKPVPADSIKISGEYTDGGYLQGFMEHEEKDTRESFRLCTSRKYFNQTEASILCKYFGYTGGGDRLDARIYLAQRTTRTKKIGSLPFFTCRNVDGIPFAKNLSQCTAGDLIKDPKCPDIDIVYVRCYGDRSLRLLGGPSINEGRLQIYLNKTWYNACSDNIKDTTADTACRLMGFKANGTRVLSSKYDAGNARYKEPNVFFPYIGCDGDEDFFTNCLVGKAYNLQSTKCYDDTSDAALICDTGIEPVRNVTGKKNAGGIVKGAGGAVMVMALAILCLMLLWQ